MLATEKKIPKKYLEEILVVPTSKIFENGYFQGFNNKNIEVYLEIIKQNKQFKPRYLMEEDPNYKQIIPYVVYHTPDQVFIMQRKETAGEQRLKNKYTVGIGGHIRALDTESGSIVNWAKREFNEEILFTGDADTKIIGLVNDDSNSVGKVHMGVVISMFSQSKEIKIKSELKSGILVDKKTIDKYVDKMEDWSKLVIEKLIK